MYTQINFFFPLKVVLFIQFFKRFLFGMCAVPTEARRWHHSPPEQEFQGVVSCPTLVLSLLEEQPASALSS